MASERVTVPNIGDAHDVDVVEVLVQAGARVEREQALIVLESDKASMEIPSPHAGVVKEVSIKAGDKVSEGALILVIDTEAGAGAVEKPKPTAAAAPAKPTTAEPVKPTAAAEKTPAQKP